MKDIFEIAKSYLDDKKKLLELIASLLAIIIGLSGTITKIIKSPISISIICIGLFFFIRMVYFYLKTSTKKSFEISVNAYNPSEIKIMRRIYRISYVLFLYPAYLLINYGYVFLSQKSISATNSKNLAVLISNFSASKDDDLATTLYSKLDEYLQDADTVKIIQIKKFITNNDSLENIFKKSANRGLLVFGKRKDADLFDCRIFIWNFFNVETNSVKCRNGQTIYIHNPDILNFSIDYQSEIISKFVLGLLYFRSGQYNLSKARIAEALNLSNQKNNRRFISLCHYFIGNGNLKQDSIGNAIAEYKKGIATDSSNAYLHYNLGATYLDNADTTKAIQEFNTAQQLDDKMKSPILKKEVSINKTINRIVHETVPITKIESQYDSSEHKKSIIINNSIRYKGPDVFFKIVMDDNYKSGVINGKGDTLIRCQYDGVKAFNYKDNVFFIVRYSSKFGAIYLKDYLNRYSGNPRVTDVSLPGIKHKIQVLVDNDEMFRFDIGFN